MHRLIVGLLFLLVICPSSSAENIAQFRGPNRDGVFPEAGLLKSWPESGPTAIWSRNDLDKGFASVSVTQDSVYLAGRAGDDEFLTVLDLQGETRWRLKYGQGVKGSYPETRCTPTVLGNLVYVISGRGQVVCIDAKKRAIKWAIDAHGRFQGEFWKWEIAESPLLVGDKVIYTPGGDQTSVVAFNRLTGETVWRSESLKVPTAFVSPIVVEIDKRKIIVAVLTEYILGVDAADGKILWKVRYHDIETPTFHEYAPKNNCVTPLYHEGHLFVTSGYDHVGVMFKLVDGGAGIEQVWINKDLDNHHGQVVKVGPHIYGSNWIDNRTGNWCCVDWKTGKTVYEEKWQTKGAIVAADGMLYCYDEKRGNLALVPASPEDFTVVSSFLITHGSGPHWSQPVIGDGVLYIRHGETLVAYDIKAKAAASSGS